MTKVSNPLKTITCLLIAILLSSFGHNIEAQIKKVPSDFPTIAQAIAGAQSGDTIILSPGTYSEKGMTINKPLTISSEWILTGDEAKIESTVIDALGGKLFTINSDEVEVSGLKIINGDHTLDIHANVSVKYNLMINNLDAVSMESGGGGYVGYNLFENNGDEGIDLDINENGSDIIIEYNTIDDSNDDGIEIRLFTAPNQNIHYEIRNNIIIGSKRAAIQIISYDVYTGKVFNIHHNVFQNCMTGLGCMEGSNTTENLNGASKMDEIVYFYNNTSIGNEMGATGANNIIAMNNLITENTSGGLKMFGANSVIANNLFYSNNNDLIEINASTSQSGNIFATDPLLDDITYIPESNSPCIDAGLDKYIMNEISVIEISSEEYIGSAPDIGAIEYNPTQYIDEYFSNASGSYQIINYPNPFILSTNISLNIPQTENIKVDIYDMMGRSICTLKNDIMQKGIHTIEWSARDENGNKLPGGIYFARIQTSNITRNTKMLLLD